MATWSVTNSRQRLQYAPLPVRVLPAARALPRTTDWRTFLRSFLGPDALLAPRHERTWAWFAALTPGRAPAPLIECWGRGGGKSTSIEGGVAWIGSQVERRRRFVLYVSGTQAQANAHVQAISTTFERFGIGRAVNKYNQSKGWTQSLLRTAGGFNVLAFGLDAAMRGIKIDLFRPDLIVLDDIDAKRDTAETTAKKQETITETVLPSGATDAAVVFVQNLIQPDSLMAQLADGRADFLLDRLPVVVEPAVIGLTYEQQAQADGTSRYVVTGGTPTWDGQPLDVVATQINSWGLTAFLREAQHEVDDDPNGMFAHLTFRQCAWSAVPLLDDRVVWVDPAVTSTDQSDAMGIQASGAIGETVYHLWSWEQRTSPQDAMQRAILKALELGASRVGVETDQGGDTWQSVYDAAWRALLLSGQVPPSAQLPRFVSAKAGAGHGPKAERGQKLVTAYERGQIVHVLGTHDVLERGLRRYLLRKPYDLVDASYWAWWDLTRHRQPYRPAAGGTRALGGTQERRP